MSKGDPQPWPDFQTPPPPPPPRPEPDIDKPGSPDTAQIDTPSSVVGDTAAWVGQTVVTFANAYVDLKNCGVIDAIVGTAALVAAPEVAGPYYGVRLFVYVTEVGYGVYGYTNMAVHMAGGGDQLSDVSGMFTPVGVAVTGTSLLVTDTQSAFEAGNTAAAVQSMITGARDLTTPSRTYDEVIQQAMNVDDIISNAVDMGVLSGRTEPLNSHPQCPVEAGGGIRKPGAPGLP